MPRRVPDKRDHPMMPDYDDEQLNTVARFFSACYPAVSLVRPPCALEPVDGHRANFVRRDFRRLAVTAGNGVGYCCANAHRKNSTRFAQPHKDNINR
jgi:hypothetical protein